MCARRWKERKRKSKCAGTLIRKTKLCRHALSLSFSLSPWMKERKRKWKHETIIADELIFLSFCSSKGNDCARFLFPFPIFFKENEIKEKKWSSFLSLYYVLDRILLFFYHFLKKMESLCRPLLKRRKKRKERVWRTHLLFSFLLLRAATRIESA